MTSWAALLDPRWHGRAALVNEPAIGIFDAALAAQSAGLMTFNNLGNMSIEEIDRLLDILEERKKAGFSAGFWRSAEDAANLMTKSDTQIQSMWSLEISKLNSARLSRRTRQSCRGLPRLAWRALPVEAALRPDARRGTPIISTGGSPAGPAGGGPCRGGYMSTPARSRPHMTPAEWDYWYEGLPGGD